MYYNIYDLYYHTTRLIIYYSDFFIIIFIKYKNDIKYMTRKLM